MEYHIKYNFSCVFTLHTKWSLDAISVMDSLIDTQTVIELSSVKWTKVTFILIYLLASYQYHCI